MRWLALDVGRVRVGVALSDSDAVLVTPLAAVPFAGPEALAKRVADLVETWEVEGVVVGWPRTRAGSGRGEQRVAEVVAVMRGLLGVPVEMEDESGTTKAAAELLREAGVSQRRRRGIQDSVAAKLILESFLARVRRSCTAGVDVDHRGDE